MLPPNLPAPPSFRKVNPADQPIFYVAMSSATLPLPIVNEYAETQLAQRLSTIPGVAQVQVFGAQKYAVRIRANPDQLAARGIGIDELQQAVAQANVNQPVGMFDGSRQTFAIKDNGQLADAAAYRPLIVAWRNGAPVRLDDVATPIDSVENNKIASWNVDQRAIVLAVQRQREKQARQREWGKLRHRPRHPAAAGRQHDRDRRFDSQDPAWLQGQAAGGD